METNDFLKEALELLGFTVGRQGPVDAQHATAVVQVYALLAIAQELRRMNERADAASDRFDAGLEF